MMKMYQKYLEFRLVKLLPAEEKIFLNNTKTNLHNLHDVSVLKYLLYLKILVLINAERRIAHGFTERKCNSILLEFLNTNKSLSQLKGATFCIDCIYIWKILTRKISKP